LLTLKGYHLAHDFRTTIPVPYLAYYPAIYPQDKLGEEITFFSPAFVPLESISAGHPSKYESLEARKSYDTKCPIDLASFGSTTSIRLGDVTLARSGDKGANLNFGIFVRSAAHWDWLRTYLSRDQMRTLLGEDNDDRYYIERVEFPNLWAVHFVIYGILGRGVSSSTKLDSLGKGFADYIRDKWIEFPTHLFVSLA
jgi:hypothetical protein